MRRIFALLFLAILLFAPGFSQDESESTFKPKDGFVPNKDTAIKIAEAVLIPVYGEKQIVSERPFQAELKGNVWTIVGTLNCGGRDCAGGAAEVRISKTTGEILFMIHYK